MTSLFQCGFIRTNISNGLEKIHHTSKKKRYLSFLQQFSVCNFVIVITERHFHRKFKDQKAHTLNNCSECNEFHGEQPESIPTVRRKKCLKTESVEVPRVDSQHIDTPKSSKIIEIPIPETENKKKNRCTK